MRGMGIAMLAQAAMPAVIDESAAIVLPVVLVLLGAAAAIGESRWRVANTEKRVEALEARQTTMEGRVGGVEAQLGTAMAILGRVEKGVEDIQRDIREVVRRSA